jgi:hypothetical protein
MVVWCIRCMAVCRDEMIIDWYDEMIIENIQYWLCTEVVLQQSMITSFHYSCIQSHIVCFQ